MHFVFVTIEGRFTLALAQCRPVTFTFVSNLYIKSNIAKNTKNKVSIVRDIDIYTQYKKGIHKQFRVHLNIVLQIIS